MPAFTTLFEFKLPTLIESKDSWSNVIDNITTHLNLLDFEAQTEFLRFSNSIGSALLSGKNNKECSVKVNKHLLTIDLHETVDEEQDNKLTDQITENLKDTIAKQLASLNSVVLPSIKRGSEVFCYYPTTDNKLIEYDFDRCSFHQQSTYQDVCIMHSPQFGNMLILDGDPNLAESDLSYTHAIMGYGRENYQNKTVLILGGGDGSLLHEILKEKPAFITMVDIDGVVVEAATKHLRRLCGSSMDQLKGDNYEVLIEDCVPVLKQYITEGKSFDYVINDLTAIPVTTEPVGDQWDFLRSILDLSMGVLKNTGKYYTQGNGANMKDALRMYELQLSKLSEAVKFSTETVCVPSYHEMWVFYEIWKQSST